MNERKMVQISIVVRNMQKSLENYWKILGIGPWDVYTFSSETCKEFFLDEKPVKEPFKFLLALTNFGGIQLELVQPVEGPTPYEKFLREHGEGLHHIKEKVDDADLERTVEEYKRMGVEVILNGRFDEDIFYYLDTRPTLGIIYELGNCGKIRGPEKRYPADAP